MGKILLTVFQLDFDEICVASWGPKWLVNTKYRALGQEHVSLKEQLIDLRETCSKLERGHEYKMILQ